MQIVDRGFHDVAAVFEEMGYDVKMPDFLDKSRRQFTVEEANETRLVTKRQWVVGSFHARFKKWRMFSERIDQSFILNIAALTRTLAACLNKYCTVLHDSNSPEHQAITHRMLQAQQRQSEIEHLISNNLSSMRKNWIPLVDVKAELKYTTLSLDLLRKYTCGTYQIKQRQGYSKQHMCDNVQEFTLELSQSDEDLLRCRLHSRHSNNTKYFLCIRFDNTNEEEPIKEHYCQYKSGSRMVGCCGHVLQQYCGILDMRAISDGSLRHVPMNLRNKLSSANELSCDLISSIISVVFIILLHNEE